MTTWEDNAEEYKVRLMEAAEGWRFAVLVVSSCERGTGGPRQLSTDGQLGKASIREFAERAEISKSKCANYFQTWDNAAEDGVVPPAHEMTPDSPASFAEPAADWKEYYKNRAEDKWNRDGRVEVHELTKIIVERTDLIEKRFRKTYTMSPQFKETIAELRTSLRRLDAALATVSIDIPDDLSELS